VAQAFPAAASPSAADELKLARIHCRGMRELIESNPAHWKDEHALELLRALCRKAWVVMRDPVCRACLAAVEDYAAALPWRADATGWSPGRLLVPWVVRREVLRKLRLLAQRLDELARAAGSPAGATSIPRDVVTSSAPPGTPTSERRRERYATALRRAAQSVGGAARLALVLRVPRQEVDSWLAGRQEAPLEAFLGSLDLVAAGPFVRDGNGTPGGPRVGRDVSPRAPACAAQAPRRRFAEPFERALFALVVGAALIGAGGWVAYFRGTPGLAAAAGLAAWFCVAAALLARCVREKAEPSSVQLALVGIALLFGAGMLFVPRLERPPVAAARPALNKALPAPPAVALTKATATPIRSVDSPLTRPQPRRTVARTEVASAAGPSARPVAERAVAFDAPENRCSSLGRLGTLQCLRCEHESGLQRFFCQERVRLQYCEGRDGAEAACPSVIPVSLPQ
jgi:hypothetical protein